MQCCPPPTRPSYSTLPPSKHPLQEQDGLRADLHSAPWADQGEMGAHSTSRGPGTCSVPDMSNLPREGSHNIPVAESELELTSSRPCSHTPKGHQGGGMPFRPPLHFPLTQAGVGKSTVLTAAGGTPRMGIPMLLFSLCPLSSSHGPATVCLTVLSFA